MVICISIITLSIIVITMRPIQTQKQEILEAI